MRTRAFVSTTLLSPLPFFVTHASFLFDCRRFSFYIMGKKGNVNALRFEKCNMVDVVHLGSFGL